MVYTLMNTVTVIVELVPLHWSSLHIILVNIIYVLVNIIYVLMCSDD